MTDNKKTGSIMLLGRTESGEKFRPSDWAHRLSISVATIGVRKRIVHHPRVHMATHDGLPAVVINRILEEENQMMFEFFLNFARGNKLMVLEIDD